MIKTQFNQYDSSTIESSVYYHTDNNLYVTFTHATYVYLNVDYNDYLQFSTAESQGKALNSYIKGKYECTKVDL